MLSGDSTVQEFNFNGCQVEFLFEDYDSDEDYLIKIKTPIVFSEAPSDEGCVHIRLESTANTLPVEPKSGRFILPSKFEQQMAAIRKGFHVLAGLKASEYQKIFTLQGSEKILVCPIKNDKSITIEKKS